ncbi:MAG: type II toxin-antitoxin system RelE/ParE family toxin [Acidimicrobiia bacterium]|nr:type II toxin-antitoxin system RelE/ParE family toxin [Acidimicrobiia bacterium]
MTSTRRRWRFYSTVAGRMPVREFLDDRLLPAPDRDEIFSAMKDVQRNGFVAARHLRGDLYEIRAEGLDASYRILFAAEGAHGQVLLGLSAFSKKTQRTPRRELDVAGRRLADWRSRGRRPLPPR